MTRHFLLAHHISTSIHNNAAPTKATTPINAQSQSGMTIPPTELYHRLRGL